jgi:hypothetical protein
VVSNFNEKLSNVEASWLNRFDNYEFRFELFDYLFKHKYDLDYNKQEKFAIEAVKLKREERNVKVDLENEIIIDKNLNGTVAECVISNIIQQNNFAKKVVDAITNGNGKFKIKFVAGDTDFREARTSPVSENGLITITLNPSGLNKNSLELASDLLHEIAHAQLLRVRETGNRVDYNLSITDFNRLMQLLDYYRENAIPNFAITNSDHAYMVERFVNPITSGVRNFDNNAQSIENYKYFGWSGLEEMGVLAGLITNQEFSRLQTLANLPKNDNNQNLCD